MSGQDLKKLKAEGSLLNSAIEYAYQNLVPLFATIEIDLKCNFRCLHCYNFDRNDEAKQSLYNQSLSKDKIFEVLDQLQSLGCLYVAFSGGEPLLHKDLESIIEYAHQLNMVVRLKTNGTLLTQERAQKLYQAGLSAVDISMYGFSESTYAKFCKVNSGFNQFLKSIKASKEAQMMVTVNIILHQGNFHELDQMIEFCRNENVNYSISDEITDRYDGTKVDPSIKLSKENFIELLHGKYKNDFQYENNENQLQCSCARSVIGISARGDIYPCIGAPIVAGNVFKDSLLDVWKSSSVFSNIRNLKKDNFEKCSSCEFINSCARSSGSIYTNTKDYTGCDDATILHAKLRSENK